MFLKSLLVMCVIASPLIMSGCSMISSAKKAYIDEMVNTTPERDYIEKSEEAMARADIDEHMKEWQALAPDIKKVISLSQEFDYLLQQMNGQNSGSFVGEVGRPKTETISQLESTNSPFVQTSVSLPHINDNQVNPAIPHTDDKFSNTNNVSTMPAQVGAETILVGRADPLPVVHEDKFSRSATQIVAPSKRLQNPVSEENMLTTSTLNDVIGEDCRVLSNTLSESALNGTKFALHLASYTDEENLKAGYTQFRTKFEESLCGKVAVSKSVNVKGTNYFSLRVGPFAIKEEAKQACLTIVDKNSYCAVTTFEGQQVL